MPGSLLGLSSKVRRSESGRSDRSDISAYSIDSRNSGKKVSFNKAVRVKKYPRRSDSGMGEDGVPVDISPEKRFWFKVYKNRHQKQPADGYGDHEGNNVLSDYSDREDNNGYGKLDPIAESDGPRSLPNLKYTSEIGVGTSSYQNGNGESFDRLLYPKHSSQKQVDPIPVRPNHVKKIVNKFNDEAVVKKYRDDDTDDDEEIRPTYTPHSLPPTGLSNGHRRPPEPPVDYVDGTIEGKQITKYRKNPLVNGVKVIFGMATLKKREDKVKSAVQSKNMVNIKKSQGTSTRDRPISNGYVGPYKTSIVLPEHAKDPKNRDKGKESTLSRRSRTTHNSGEMNNNRVALMDENKRDHEMKSTIRPVEIWNSGDQLISDSSHFESTTDKIADGQLFRSVGENSRVWRNEKRTVYEEEIPAMSFDRRAKSYGDLRLGENRLRRIDTSGKVLSNDELYQSSDKQYNNKNRDSRVKTLNYHYGPMKDKSTQCNRSVDQTDDSSDTSKYHRVIKSRDGYVSAYSDVPTLEKQRLQRSKTPSIMTSSTLKSNGSTLRSNGSTLKSNGSTLKLNGTSGSEVIYSQVDKTKKKKKFGASLTSTSTPRNESPMSKISKGQPPSIIAESVKSGSNGKDSNKVKSSQKSFGFRLKKAFGAETRDKSNTYSAYEEDDNWYDVDADVAAAEKRGKRNGQTETRQEVDEEFSSVSEAGSEKQNAAPASVMREMDAKKREITYENVPRQVTGHPREVSAGGMWFRNADEDYRREMAQSDVSYPSGLHEMGSSATLSRLHDKRGGNSREDVPIKSYTLDRRHAKDNSIMKDRNEKSAVKILVNGHEIDDTDGLYDGYTLRNRRRTLNRSADDGHLPSSVQSDPVSHRGGLAAAYKARQKAALKRSNSTATNSVFGSHLSVNSPARTRRNHHHNSSGGSMVSSSDSDSTRRRRTLVMYIPGVSHPERRASDDEKINVSRTQSMHVHAKPPPRYQKNTKLGSQSRLAGKSNTDLSEAANSEEADTITPLRSEMKKKNRSPGNSIGRSSRKDLRRRHSMPKDTKFGWFKWKIKGKPSKEA